MVTTWVTCFVRKSAQRLRACLRESDTVSRRGGDEFTVILGDVHGPDDAARVAQEIVEQMGTPFQVRNVGLQIGASVGAVPVSGSRLMM